MGAILTPSSKFIINRGFAQSGMQLYVDDFSPAAWFPFVWHGMDKNKLRCNLRFTL